MRKTLLAAAALALLPMAPAAAEQRSRAPAAAPKLELSAEQRSELQQAVVRGRALAVLDQAGRVASRDMLENVANPTEAGITGWIARPEGNGVTVTFFGPRGDGFEAIYKVQVLGGRPASPQSYKAGQRPMLTGEEARMAAARTAAQAVELKPCGPDFNPLVLPPEGDGPILVYRMSPRMAPDKVPLGGHYRLSVTGGEATSTPLGGACADLALPAIRAGQRPRPLVVNARDAVLPNELHVFLSLWVRRPIVVATGTDSIRLWGVTAQGIAELPPEGVAELRQ